VEWVDRANSAHILVTDTVLRATATRLIEKLIHIPADGEDCAGLPFSNGWLFNLKMQNGLFSKKTKGDGGKIDGALLPGMQDELKKELEDYAPRYVFNCDELALQYGFFSFQTYSTSPNLVETTSIGAI